MLSLTLISAQAQTLVLNELKVLGHTGGVNRAIFIKDNYLYTAEGSELGVWDIANPVSPAFVGKSPPLESYVRDIYVEGDYAYVATHRRGLHIVDLSDPENPVDVTHHLEWPRPSTKLFSAGGYLFTYHHSYAYNKTVMLDTNSTPTITEVWTDTGYSTIAQVNAYIYFINAQGTRIFTSAGSSGLVELAQNTNIRGGSVLYAQGQYAYLAHSDNLEILDISEPLTPTSVATYTENLSGTFAMCVNNNRIYLASATRIWVLDAGNPLSLTQIATYTPTEAISDLAVKDSYLHFSYRDGGFGVASLNNLNAINLQYEHRVLRYATGVRVVEPYAYLATKKDGFQIYNISNPALPVLTGVYTDAKNVHDFEIDGNYLYFVNGEKLQVMDISVISRPLKIAEYPAPALKQFIDINIEDNYSYLSADRITRTISSSLLILDISNPYTPHIAGEYTIKRENIGLSDVQGDYFYLLEHYWQNYTILQKLTILNVSDPAHITVVNEYDLAYWTHQIEVKGRYAYVTGLNWGVVTYDISNPAMVTERGRYFYALSRFLAVGDDVVYLGGAASSWDGYFQVVDVKDPAKPKPVTDFITGGDGYIVDVEASGSKCFVAGGESGFFVFDYFEYVIDLPYVAYLPLTLKE